VKFLYKSWQRNVMFLRVSQLVKKDIGTVVHADHMEVFSVVYVSGSIARQVPHGVSCDACKTYLTSEVLLRTNVFIYFKGYSDTEQSLNYPSEKLVETVVCCCNSNVVYDDRGGTLEFSGAAYNNIH
jgi:hypothetical protein